MSGIRDYYVYVWEYVWCLKEAYTVTFHGKSYYVWVNTDAYTHISQTHAHTRTLTELKNKQTRWDSEIEKKNLVYLKWISANSRQKNSKILRVQFAVAARKRQRRLWLVNFEEAITNNTTNTSPQQFFAKFTMWSKQKQILCMYLHTYMTGQTTTSKEMILSACACA